MRNTEVSGFCFAQQENSGFRTELTEWRSEGRLSGLWVGFRWALRGRRVVGGSSQWPVVSRQQEGV
jgi:hypothetical protein